MDVYKDALYNHKVTIYNLPFYIIEVQLEVNLTDPMLSETYKRYVNKNRKRNVV